MDEQTFGHVQHSLEELALVTQKGTEYKQRKLWDMSWMRGVGRGRVVGARVSSGEGSRGGRRRTCRWRVRDGVGCTGKYIQGKAKADGGLLWNYVGKSRVALIGELLTVPPQRGERSHSLGQNYGYVQRSCQHLTQHRKLCSTPPMHAIQAAHATQPI
eukprot:355325-Chlamydomonas_euryale.AAC.3